MHLDARTLYHSVRDRRMAKADCELDYWRRQARRESGDLFNGHYLGLYTDMFGLDQGFYAGRRLLDVGCGPRGSLEWADMADCRIGLDPLASSYREFGTESQRMVYVQGKSEAMPFKDSAFDVVSSLNSLDHVDDLAQTLSELRRVVRPAGSFLLEVEVGHRPTATEPICIWTDLVDQLKRVYGVEYERWYAMPRGPRQVHTAYTANVPFDRSKGLHPGVLVLHLTKRVG